jgi:A/G-specific adenine glycosylase
LAVWSGLGYNRRAKFLWEAARTIAAEYKGKIPENIEDLVRLPGIGKNTAAAVLVYAFNQPLAFVETNIRTVYIHHFFPEAEQVSDKEILSLVDQTIDTENPREFYWALMDYGTYLKQQPGNLSRLSKHYAKQSAFRGSKRQLRGEVIRRLLDRSYAATELAEAIPDERLAEVIRDLQQEGMIMQEGSIIGLHES